MESWERNHRWKSNLAYLRLIPAEGIPQPAFIRRLEGYYGHALSESEGKRICRNLLMRGLAAEDLRRSSTGQLQRVLTPKVRA